MPQPHAKRRPVQTRVFLSFSGSLSRTVAEAFAQLLRKVLRGTESWMSQDIPPGANWRAKIDEALNNTKCAIIFLTRANHVAATWVAYEAGKARHAIVYAVNFDPADLAHQPYGAWQAAKADRPGTLAMLKEINRLAGGHEKDTELQKRFASHWPAFAGALREALESFPDHPYAHLLHLRTFAGREVEVWHLNVNYFDRSNNAIKLPLATAEDGICFLASQMQDIMGHFQPDLIVGVNNHGLLLAAGLAMRSGHRAASIGYFRTGSLGEIVHESLPKLPDARKNTVDILIVDLKVAKGNVLRKVTERLQSRYGGPARKLSIRAAVLVAAEIPPPARARMPRSIRELLHGHGRPFATKNLDYLPRLLAFTTSEKTAVLRLIPTS